MTGRAFTRAEIQAMSQEQLAANIADVNAWTAAGAVDGQAPPDRKSSYTVEELRAMTAEEMAENIAAVNASLGGAV